MKVQIKKGLIAVTSHWVLSNLTEQKAYELIHAFIPEQSNFCYLAFPWAQLFTELRQVGEKSSLRRQLERIQVELLKYDRVLTVCQDASFLEFEDMVAQSGVTDVYWVHAVTSAEEVRNHKMLRIHSFPEYSDLDITLTQSKPVTRYNVLINESGLSKSLWGVLRAHQDELGASNFNEAFCSESTPSQRIVKRQKFQFEIQRSLFCICGDKPVQSRKALWQSIHAGSIPIVFRRDWLLPGSPRIWQDAIIFCEPTEYGLAKLQKRLVRIINDNTELNRMRRNLAQLQLLYRPDIFVADLLSEVHDLYDYYNNDANRDLAEALTLSLELKNREARLLSVLSTLTNLNPQDRRFLIKSRQLQSFRKDLRGSKHESLYHKILSHMEEA